MKIESFSANFDREDDIEFPDVESFSFPEIIHTIRDEHERACEELGY